MGPDPGAAMTFIVVPMIILYTAVLGTLGILLCLLVPGGAALMPLARLWSRLVLLTSRVRWVSSADPALDPSRPCVYAANHQSQFDIPALVLAMPADFRMVAKRSLAHVPIFGWALRLAGFVFIDRSNRESAIQTLDQAAERLRRGTSIVVFAEGTRSRDGTLLPFKRGGFVMALKAGVPVVPVTIRGGGGILPKGSLWIRPGSIQVHFGAPVETTGYTYETRDRLADRVRAAIEAELQKNLKKMI
jgi:1-acyl-sn-glycerol-3-phosphate acyltransferase